MECLWIEVINPRRRILFGLFYRAPNSDANYYNNIEDSVSLAVDTGIKDIVITGDFNLNYPNHTSRRKIDSLCMQFSLHQSISQPTHFTEHSSSLTDIILVSNKENLILSGVTDPFLNQDVRFHCPVYGVLKFSKPKSKAFVRHIWSYENGNYELLREKASAFDWQSLENDDLDIYANNINSCILSLAAECIPNKHVRIKPLDPPWLTATIKCNIRKRKRAYKKARHTNLDAHWATFKNIRNDTTTLIRSSKQQFYDKLAAKLKSENLSPKDWWATLKSFITTDSNSDIPPIEINGQTYTDDYEKANILNDYFQSQTILDDSNVRLPDLPPPTYNTTLNRIVITNLEVKSALQTLKTGKASGPNGLSNRILRELSSELSHPLCCLFNKSLQSGIVPSSYKEANVCPIHKKGDRSNVCNYRPISLLNSENKVLERLIFKNLYNHLLDNNFLSSFQSGFIPGDSTENQLTFLYHTFCEALDAGKEVRAVFCDISKAFDRVWHTGLLYKLRTAGVTGNVLQWFKNYLSDRKQRVVLPGISSAWNFIKAGVPQGSILGPLLFLVYINDIVTDIGSNIRLFADDTSLYIVVDNPLVAAETLNADLEKISRWAATWLVTFNPNKSVALLLSRKVGHPLHPPLFMENTPINEVEAHKHLGLFLSNDCSWHQHINYIKDKAWARINIMRRLKYKLDRKSLESIYISFIRPLLEYGDTIWDNCTQYEKYELDKIQNEAARIATGATKLVSLTNLYKEIGLESLSKRRNNHKLTLLYKMINHLTPIYLSSLIPAQVSSASRYNLRNAQNYQTIRARTNQYRDSFLPSTLHLWNNLPLEARQSNTLNSFKLFLKKDILPIPRYYYHGNRKPQILHSRLRTGCSVFLI